MSKGGIMKKGEQLEPRTVALLTRPCYRIGSRNAGYDEHT
jgi:hypothetical protein